MTSQDIEVKQEFDSLVKEEAQSEKRKSRKSSYNRRQSIADDSELMASISRDRELSGMGFDFINEGGVWQPQTDIKIEEMELEKKQNQALSEANKLNLAADKSNDKGKSSPKKTRFFAFGLGISWKFRLSFFKDA